MLIMATSPFLSITCGSVLEPGSLKYPLSSMARHLSMTLTTPGSVYFASPVDSAS